MQTPTLVKVCLLSFALGSVSAQTPNCNGNGGNARLETSVLAVGEQVTFSVLGTPGAAYQVFMSSGLGLNAFPGFGTVCLDFAGLFPLFAGTIPASGRFDYGYTAPATWGSVLFFTQGIVDDPQLPSGLALTNTLRKDYEFTDTYAAAGSLHVARGHATADLLSTDWVLIAGGSTTAELPLTPVDATDLYVPLSRSTIPGPSLTVPRVLHATVRLADDRIFLTGGVSDAIGTVTPSCDLYDPGTGLITPAAAMGTPRAGHAATVLPDGRVLVLGGTTTFAPNGTDPTPIYTSSLATTELYDPATDTWTPGGSMNSPRMGHSVAATLFDEVIAVSGINTGLNLFVTPTYITTPSVDVASATGTLAATSPVPSSGGAFGALRSLPGGRAWFAGGGRGFPVTTGVAHTTTHVFHRFSNTWAPGPNLPVGVAHAGSVSLPNGRIYLVGGASSYPFTASTTTSSQTLSFDGTALVPLAPLPIACMAPGVAPLVEGTFLVAGGLTSAAGIATPLSSVWLYTPEP